MHENTISKSGDCENAMTNNTRQELTRLLGVMRRLRDPDTGCDWDKRQTFASLAPYTLEEAYEVLDAVARQDSQDLRDELGDVLLHVVFYAQIASEQGLFDFADVCAAISDKLQRRHPHIFAHAPALSWEQLKADERAQKAQQGLLDDIAPAQPALMQAQKIQQRCAGVGFDWADAEQVVDKVYEELAEVLQEIRQDPVQTDRLDEEIGDLLFSVVNLARHVGSKAEMALARANRKFIRRFGQLQARLTEQGVDLRKASLTQMEAAWQWAKQTENER